MKKIPFDAEKARAGVPAYDGDGGEWKFVMSTDSSTYPLLMKEVLRDWKKAMFTEKGYFLADGSSNLNLHMLEEEKSVAQRAREGAKLKTGDDIPAKFVAYEEGCEFPLVVRIGDTISLQRDDGKLLRSGEEHPMDIVIDEEPETVTAIIGLIDDGWNRFFTADFDKLPPQAEVLASQKVTFTVGKFAGSEP